MSAVNLRDRDGLITKEGLIFRVFGYSHPSNIYICDAEYASSDIFKSNDPRALRDGAGKSRIFYKFYDDEGLKFVLNNFPQYSFKHEMLQQTIIGVNIDDIYQVRSPQDRLFELASMKPRDNLHASTLTVLTILLERTDLSLNDFGVFGSMLHNFHHSDYSDIDLLIYGIKQNSKIRDTLSDLYAEKDSGFSNEFDNEDSIKGKKWRFINFSPKEFLWHQKRKLIYGLYKDSNSRRVIKAEFEPVKDWCEIFSEYNPQTKIIHKDWVRVKARVVADVDGPFIPSVYGIEPLEVLNGSKEALEAVRIVSYMEEFRQQVCKDEIILVEGTLEEVVSKKGSFFQITLTYCPRYYEQMLKTVKIPNL